MPAIFQAAVSEGKAVEKTSTAIRAGLSIYPQGGVAFKAAKATVVSELALGYMVSAGRAKNRADAVEIVASFKNKETRDADLHKYYESVSKAHAYRAVKNAGYGNEEHAAKLRATKGSQAQTTKASDKPAAPVQSDAPVSVPTFTKDYDASADMCAIAARLAKGIASKPKAFQGGLHAIASDFITAMAAYQKAEAAKEQN